MATPLDRIVGGTTAGAYGRGPASGVDYFSAPGRSQGAANITPGAQDLIIEDEPYDVGVYDRGGGGGGYGGSEAMQGSPQSAANLGTLGTGLSLAGQFMGDPSMSMAGGALGAVSAGQRGNIGPAVGMATGLMTGNPALAAMANYGTQMATGTFSATPTNVGGIVGGLVGGPIGSMIGSTVAGGLLGTNSTMSPMGVPNPGYAGLLGTNLGTQLGAEAFGNPSTPAGIGTEGGVGFGLGGAAGVGNQVGQVGADMGGAQGVTGSTAGAGVGGMTAGGGLGLSAPSDAFGGIGAGSISASDSDADGNGASDSAAAAGGIGTGNDSYGGGWGGSTWADGGMIQPGLTRRFADGGPLLAMGYADGGGVQMGPTPGSTSVTSQVNRILRDPRMKQEIATRAQALMDSGELTPDEVQVMARVAEAAMFNQQLYPQLRQFVAEQGMTPLPAAYDPATIVKIMAIARVLQEVQPATPPGQVPPTEQAQLSPPPGMNQGGLISGPGTGRSDSIGTVNRSSGEPVSVANNEYIIPEHVVRVKGREFFDKLLARYENAPKEQA